MKRVTNVKCYRTNDGRYFRASVINILVAIAIAFMLIAFIVFFSEVVIDDTMEFLLHMFLKTVICGGIGFVGYMILRWVGKTFWKTAPYHFRMIEELFFYIKKRKLYFYIFLFILVHHRGVEPRTFWLRVSCSTNWASGASLLNYLFIIFFFYCVVNTLATILLKYWHTFILLFILHLLLLKLVFLYFHLDLVLVVLVAKVSLLVPEVKLF